MSDSAEATNAGTKDSTPEDVRWAFAVFLGRPPEAPSVEVHYSGRPLFEMLTEIATSDEAQGVRGSNHTKGWFAVHRANPALRPTDALEWYFRRISPHSMATAASEIANNWASVTAATVAVILENNPTDPQAKQLLQVCAEIAPLSEHVSGAFGVEGSSQRPQSLSEAVGIWNKAASHDFEFLHNVSRQLQRSDQGLLFSDVFFDPYTVYARRAGTQMSQTALVEAAQFDRRSENAAFNTRAYITKYPDVDEAGEWAPLHYVRSGRHEGRDAEFTAHTSGAPHPDFSSIYNFVTASRGRRADEGDPTLRRWLIDLQTRIIAAGLANKGWVGDQEISRHVRFYAETDLPNGDVACVCDAATSYMLGRYYSETPPVETFAVDQTWIDLYRKSDRSKFAINPFPIKGRSSMLTVGVSIITPFWGHINEFGQCAASVALAVAQTVPRFEESPQIEWVVINDDPRFSDEDLLARVPASLQPYLRIMASGGNVGTTKATNRAISEARFPWLMFLDCDDLILPDALLVMNYYSAITEAPYIASAMIDIDDSNAILRFRRHEAPASAAPRVGMNAGHLKAIHRSLFDRYGPLDPVYNSCQDYEFLLRILKDELVAVIPEYLYMYRWHNKTQSITRFAAQEQAAAAAKYKHVVNPKVARPIGPTPHTVGMIIRTRGERNESLAEAIGSCTTAEPGVQIIPIVAVHGAANRVDHVSKALERRGLTRQDYQLVHASAQDRYRGYPLNAGAKHALDVLGCSAIGIVDDDDIILPAFTHMVKRLRADKPAIVTARTLAADMAGRKEEMHLPLPAASLVFENFIPTNGFVANRAALNAVISKYGQLFPEDLHYLEDWHFFVAALDVGTEFSVFDEVVAEFRLGSDGNADQRKYPFEFERCRVRVQQFAERVKRTHGAKLLQQQGHFPQRLLGRMGARQRKNLLSLVGAGEKS